jgi:hypothetical protein
LILGIIKPIIVELEIRDLPLCIRMFFKKLTKKRRKMERNTWIEGMVRSLQQLGAAILMAIVVVGGSIILINSKSKKKE